jgi:hypothetical protein
MLAVPTAAIACLTTGLSALARASVTVLLVSVTMQAEDDEDDDSVGGSEAEGFATKIW